MKVLCRADHATIEGGRFRLSDYEISQIKDLPWLPRSVERRISGDTYRTQRIIEAYDNYIGPDWPTLIFATSVEHAQTLAALLNN